MNEKEIIADLKKTIEYAQKCYREDAYINQETLFAVLNLLEKKDIDIIETKEANRQLSIELQKKDKIIYEIAKSNVKLKGYDVEETYINNTISFYTKYIENLERNPHWREESRKWKLKLKIM